jgi:hypothetical protein
MQSVDLVEGNVPRMRMLPLPSFHPELCITTFHQGDETRIVRTRIKGDGSRF